MHPASRDQARAARAEHGRLPRRREWDRATASRPCAKTIERRWGWRELLAEALGARPNEVNVSWEGVLDSRAEAMLAALRAACDELGRWPTATEWDRSGQLACARTFVRHLGSWAEACRAASLHTTGSELWFNTLQRRCLRRGDFPSAHALEAVILAFIATYNRLHAHPYRWTYSGDPLAA